MTVAFKNQSSKKKTILLKNAAEKLKWFLKKQVAPQLTSHKENKIAHIF